MIPEVNPYNNYRGDGVATLFDYDFFIQNGSQLIVEHIDENDVVTRLEENIDYEIVVIEEEFAGYIKFPIEDSKFGILQENETLSLQLTLPFEQISEYGQSSLLDLNSIEFSLDYLTRLCQILKRQMERSVRVNEGSEATPEQLLEIINNNAIVSTNAAAIASKKADEATESANVAINASGEIDIKINGFNETYENIKEEIIEEGEKQLQNVQSTGFYMRDDKLYFINSKGEEEEFKSGGGGLEVGDIGIAPLGLDETQNKRRYLNGQLIIQEQFLGFTEKLKSAVELYPTLACTEEEWQTIATMSVGGQVGKFVIDNNAGTIRLPRIIMPIQGLTNLTNLAEIVKAGLPDINASITDFKLGQGATTSGAYKFTKSKTDEVLQKGSSISTGTLSFDASRANSTYGNSNTVQQEQIQYPYFIQVATGAETKDEIINEHELVNPYVLLEPKFFETPVYNLSWLISNGSFTGSKAVHPHAYDALLIELNADIAVGTTQNNYNKRGLPVKLATDSYTDYDFVVNPADETFRPPLKVNLASSKAVVGNGNVLGLWNGDRNFSLIGSVGTNNGLLGTGLINSELGSGPLDTVRPLTLSGSTVSGVALGVTTDPTKSGLELADSNLYLYFYVGEVAQNTNLVNAGRIEEIKANKTDVDGQWQSLSMKIVENATIGINANLEYDVSSLLPNDGYEYLVGVEMQHTSASGATMAVRGKALYVVVRTQTANANAMNYGVIVVGTDRKVRITSVSVSVEKAYVTLAWVRRIGTNQ